MDTISKEKLAELALKHPNKRLNVIEYTFDDEPCELVATIPTRTQLQRAMAEAKVSEEQAAATLAMDCIIFPDADALLEERFIAMMNVTKELLRLGGEGQAARPKKQTTASNKPAPT